MSYDLDGDGGIKGSYYFEYSGDENVGKESVVIPKDELDGAGTYDVTIDYSLALQGHSGEADLRFYARTTEQGDKWGLPDDVRIADWSISSGDKEESDVKTITLEVKSGDAGIVLIGHLDNEQPGTSYIDAEVIAALTETTVGASATVFSWVPGLSENESEGGNDLHSAFPDQGPVPLLPIDAAFLGDKAQSLEETVEETLEMRKSVEDLDGEHRQYRFKNTVEVSFDVDSNETIKEDRIEIAFNSFLPDEVGSQINIDRNPTLEYTFVNPDAPEPLSNTIVEENVNDHINLSLVDLTQWENDRTQTAYPRPRFATILLDDFTFRNDTIEGVRVADLWGAENPYMRDLAKPSNIPFIWGANPIIYHWIDMIALADGTYAVRVQDATQFPMHTLFTGPAGEPAEQYKRTDSGLEIIYDTNASTDKEYAAAVHEDNHKPWGQFFGSFDDDTKFVPYKTPKKRYLKNHDKDTTDRWFGFKNELLVDHPMMTYGMTGDEEELSTEEVLELLPEPQSPFPGLFPYSFD